MAVKMEQAGVALIELSGGTYESNVFIKKSQSTSIREACVTFHRWMGRGFSTSNFRHFFRFFIEFAERIRPHLTDKSRLCVTGGFRSASAMATCLQSNICDVVGIGRPLCSETDLCAKLTSGRSKKALENCIDPSMQISAAYLQEIRLGRGMEPLDFSREFGTQAAIGKIKGTDDVSWLMDEPDGAVEATT